MKLLIALLLLSSVASAQILPNPPGYSPRNTRDNIRATIATDGQHVPGISGFPISRTGVWVGDGQLMADTAGNKMYWYSNSTWRRFVDSTYLASQLATISSTDTAWADVTKYGAIANDGLGDYWAFVLARNTGRPIFVPRGIYNIDTAFVLLNGQTIRGVGPKTIIRTDSLPTVTPFAMITGQDSVVIENIAFMGDAYAAYNSGPTFTMQNAIYLSGSYNTVRGCRFDSLRGAGVIMYEPSLSLVYNNKIHDNTFLNNAVGIQDYANSEYTTIINNTMRLNDYNIMMFGGNFRIVGNALDYSHSVGLYIKGNTNGDHGSVVGNSFNHSDALSIQVVDCPIGVVFGDNNVFFGNISISESDNVKFDNTGMSTVTVSIAATGVTKTTTFSGGYKDAVTFNAPTGTAELLRIGIIDKNHSIYSIDADTLHFRTNGYSRLFFDGAGKVVFGNESSPNQVTQVDIKTSSNLGGMGNSGLRISDVFAGPNVVLTPVTGNLLGVYNTSSALTGIIFSQWVNGNDGSTITANSNYWQMSGTTKWGIGVTPTARLHMAAGTSAANTSPMKFTSGTNLTTPEAGSMEYDGTSLFFSPSTTRLRAVLTNNAIPSNGQIPIGNGTNYTVANITSDGTVTVTNGAGSIQLGVASTFATSGTYTPTLTNTTNVAASTPHLFNYMRVGEVVTVSGTVEIDPTATGGTELLISLPVSSSFSDDTHLGGSALTATSIDAGQIVALSGGGEARVRFVATEVSNKQYAIHFTYRIIN